MASALAAANSRPSSESPAWKITGRPCGLRGTAKRPSMSNWVECTAKRPASGSRRNTPDPWSATTSSPDHESNSVAVAARNSWART